MTGHPSGWGRFYSGARPPWPHHWRRRCTSVWRQRYTASVGETSSSRRLMTHTIYKAIADTGHEMKAANMVLKYMG